MPNATKVIKAKIVHLTKIKERLLSEEYGNLQKFLHGDETVKLYSANKQQARRYYKKIKPNKEYPISIRKDLIKVERRNTKIAQYWVRIPVAGKRGGIWVAIKPHEDILPDYEIEESKVFRRNGDWYIHITVHKEVNLKKSYDHVLAADIGERVMACVCGTWNSLKPIFYGREIRGIRRHYAWLRRRLQEKKLLKKVKQIGNKERRIVNDLLHKISREIVNLAKEHNAVIVMGNLKGIRQHAKSELPPIKIGGFRAFAFGSYWVTDPEPKAHARLRAGSRQPRFLPYREETSVGILFLNFKYFTHPPPLIHPPIEIGGLLSDIFIKANE